MKKERQPKNKTSIIMWVLAGFMALSGIVYFPSVASVIMFAFAMVAAPIGPWQEFLSGVGLRGWIKGVVLCAAFIGSIMTAPTSRPNRAMDFPNAQPSYHGTLPSKAPEKGDTPAPEKTPAPTEAATPTPAPTPEPTPAPTPTPEPTPAPTPAPAQPQGGVPSSENSGGGGSGGGSSGGTGNGSNFQTWDNPDQQQTSQSWVLNTSTMKVHYPSCSSVARIAPQNYAASNAPLDELLGRGYSRCGRCF